MMPDPGPLPMAGVLAHQGNWDEMLFIAVPVGFVVFLLWLANRRAARRQGPPAPRPGATIHPTPRTDDRSGPPEPPDAG